MLGRLKFNIDALVNEILDTVPEETFESKTTTFLDPAMAGGQFLKAVISRLRKYGHSDTNIAGRIFGYETNKMRVNFAAKQCGNIGTFAAINFLEEHMSKKFDVIIGNPPYQDGTKTDQQNKIYNQFSKRALLLSNRIVAFVTPVSVCKRSKRFSLINTDGLKQVDFRATNFFKVGSTICSWIVDKSYTGDINVIDSNGSSSQLIKGNCIYDYAKVNKTVASIVENIRKETVNLSERMFPRNNPGPVFSKTKNEEFVYPLLHVNKDGSTRVSGYMKKEPHYHKKQKFIMIMTRTFIEENVIISTDDYDDATVCVEVDNEIQIENLKSFLFSDYFVNFVNEWKVIDGYGFNEAIKYLPKFDKDKKWNNASVKAFIESYAE